MICHPCSRLLVSDVQRLIPAFDAARTRLEGFGPTPDAPRSGTITSIGPRECFVKTKAIVMEGQDLHVRVWMPENRWLRLSGRVKYHMDRVGFGFIFHELTEEQSAGLAHLVEEIRRQQSESDAGTYDPADATLMTGG